jgi:hypothetical protein
LEQLESFIAVLVKSREKYGLPPFPFCAAFLVVVNRSPEAFAHSGEMAASVLGNASASATLRSRSLCVMNPTRAASRAAPLSSSPSRERHSPIAREGLASMASRQAGLAVAFAGTHGNVPCVQWRLTRRGRTATGASKGQASSPSSAVASVPHQWRQRPVAGPPKRLTLHHIEHHLRTAPDGADAQAVILVPPGNPRAGSSSRARQRCGSTMGGSAAASLCGTLIGDIEPAWPGVRVRHLGVLREARRARPRAVRCSADRAHRRELAR